MHETTRTSWTPMIGLFLAQVLMSFNVAALPISLGGMVEDFSVPPTVASSTIVVYGLAVAALVMTGAKLGQRVGWTLIFRCVLAVFAASSLTMILAPTITWAIIGQLLAGAAAAIIVPALVALIAENYRGPQQATAVGSLGSARAFSGVSAFLIGGTLGTFVGWRPIFGITLALAIAVFVLAYWLDRGTRRSASTWGRRDRGCATGLKRGGTPRRSRAGGDRPCARPAVLRVDPPTDGRQGPAGGPQRAGQRAGALCGGMFGSAGAGARVQRAGTAAPKTSPGTSARSAAHPAWASAVGTADGRGLVMVGRRAVVDHPDCRELVAQVDLDDRAVRAAGWQGQGT